MVKMLKFSAVNLKIPSYIPSFGLINIKKLAFCKYKK